ncbi:carbohydrate kinase family protein [Anaerocolumna xylanovorans]|uniref:Ribokinase n=1 Tax=Anaerocolumna xylanovorans DSM 12503 TaxID=1121345 RepID=A0A1M7Y2T5_9FIRM|nr:carbohydrate kinase family protein [Anaerocolumna xylanovorans]SHO46069.1 ribokinase [Anaerocolumna xylanovorans DSM 12503]
MEKIIDVCGLGTLAMDVLMKVDMLPKEDGFCLVRSNSKQPGGSGTNVIVQLSRLTAKCGYIGAVGDDDLGKEVLKSLEAEKVSTADMIIKEGKTTLHTEIVIDDAGRKFIMLNMGDAFLELSAEEINIQSIKRARVFYTDFLPKEAALMALKAAKEADAKTVFNMQAGLETMEGLKVTKNEILDALQYVDVFAPCREGLYGLTGTTNLEECAGFLRHYCKGILLFTLGKEGSVAYDEQGKAYYASIYPVDAIDTTGAGDSYIGAFLYQYCLKNETIQESMEFAALCAGYTCTGIGARHTPTLEEAINMKANIR